ncbi:MAG: hypothetical protein QOK44_4009 [Betaproteobacteria bacterium]|nr:hypothetical protein [Betaproteobacteria bacterium]
MCTGTTGASCTFMPIHTRTTPRRTITCGIVMCTSRFPLRALAVGTMHGMAGSAALIVLTVASVKPVSLGFLQIVAFGVGSIVGMAALSLALAVPLRRSAAIDARVQISLRSLVGMGSVVLGVVVMLQCAGYSFFVGG